VPVAIIIAGLVIGAALYFRAPAPAVNPGAGPTVNQARGDLSKLAKIDPNEHLQGATGGPVKIIEYSDLECPFCKAFHFAMKELMTKYEPDGKIAWIFRDFPLDRHPKAMPEAIAAECVAKFGGNDKFWQYVDQIFATTPSNNGLDLAVLPKLATDLRIDKTKFQNCLDNNETKSIVDADYQNGLDIGVDGTPYVVMILPGGQKFLLFREATPANIDASTKAIIDDLSGFYNAQIQKLSQAQ